MNEAIQRVETKDLYQHITDQIIEALTQTKDWVMPWHQKRLRLPKNVLTQKGIRSLIETAKGYYSHPKNPHFREKFIQTISKWQTISQMNFLSSYRASLKIDRTIYTIHSNDKN